MSKSITTGLAFILGAAVGSGVTYIFMKKKCDKRIDEEVGSARDNYNRLAKELADKNKKEKEKSVNEFADMVKVSIYDPIQEGSSSTSDPLTEEKPNDIPKIMPSLEQNPDPNAPYEIDITEYGSLEDYNLVTLNYYSDGIITDDSDEIIEDPIGAIGAKLYNKLEDYEENDIFTAYARNDTRKCDYEILIDGTNFEKV